MKDIAIIHAQALGFSVDANNLAALEGNSRNGCANGGKELVGVTVDNSDVDALGIGKFTGAAKATEPGANDDNVTIAHADQPLFDARRRLPQ
jgi:hypothetical protein